MFKEEKMGFEAEDITQQNLTGVNKESPVENTPVRVLTATSIIGDDVKNYEGKDVGNIKNIMLNLKDGCIDYVILEFGGFLGFGEKLFAVPFHALELDPSERIFLLNINKEILEKAPGFDEKHWPDTNS